MSDNGQFTAIMEAVARDVLGEAIGEPNKHLSTRSELRYGKNGSLSVDLVKGTWHDHEEQKGGGVIELLRAYKGLDKGEAVQWLIEHGYLEDRGRQDGKNDGKKFEQPSIDIPGGVPSFMDPKPVAFFEYFDGKGKLAYQVLKFPKTAPRRYMQRRPHNGGWIWGLQAGTYGRRKDKNFWKAKDDVEYEEVISVDDAERWLYRRDEVLKAKKEGRQVLLVEGEKDVETVRAWGHIGTTNAGGAKYWQPSFDEDLAGADVVILNDNDDAGRQRAQIRAADLKRKAKSVKTLDISEHWVDCPEKADISDWRDLAGGTAEKFSALLAKARLWTPTPPKSMFGAVTWDRLDESGSESEYLVDSMLTIGDKSVLGGPSGSGKSFLSIHLSMSVARGVDFLGRQVMKGGVIYQAGEGGRGVKKRLRAYREHFKVPADEHVPIVLLPSKVDLFSREGDTDRLITEIKAWAAAMEDPLRLVVIDTLSTATAGADENNGKDMSLVLANIARISDETGAHVMLVHHMNSEGKKLRGHTSIYANSDQVLLVEKDEETKIRKLVLAKQKDDEDGIKVEFSLAQVKIGYDLRREKDITSCVILTVTEKERLQKQQEIQGISVNPTERRFLTNLFESIDKYGRLCVDTRDGLPAAAIGKTVVNYSDYVDVAISKMLDEDDPQKAKDKLRKSFNKMTDGLSKTGVIGMERPYIWWTGKPVRGFPRTFSARTADRQRQAEMPYDSEVDEFLSAESGSIPF